MTEALALEGGERVLEIGTGSGYTAAILAGRSAGTVRWVHLVWRDDGDDALRDQGGSVRYLSIRAL